MKHIEIIDNNLMNEVSEQAKTSFSFENEL